MNNGVNDEMLELVRYRVDTYPTLRSNLASEALSDFNQIVGDHSLTAKDQYRLRNAFGKYACERLTSRECSAVLKGLSETVPLSLTRIVYLVPDLSTIGGIQNRTRKILRQTHDRSVDYIGLSVHHKGSVVAPNVLYWEDNPSLVEETVGSWDPESTVVVFPNNTLRILPVTLRESVEGLPLIFLGSGQLSYLLQDSSALSDVRYLESVKCTTAIVLSELDRQTYQQFGLHHPIVGFHPTELRSKLEPRKRVGSVRFGYIGRIDFATKGADRLIAALEVIRDQELPSLRLFTPDNPKNSPDLVEFCELLHRYELEEHVELTVNEHDLTVLYSDIDLLLLPSKKDAFPNVVLEAFSFGIPVVGVSSAPGPSRLIKDGENGFLLEEFSNTELTNIVQTIDSRLPSLSEKAFKDHRRFGMAAYFNFIEPVARRTLHEFFGWNREAVFPSLQPVATLYERLQSREESFRAHKESLGKERAEVRIWRGRFEKAAREKLELESSMRYRLGSIIIDQSQTLRGVLRLPRVVLALARDHRRRRKASTDK